MGSLDASQDLTADTAFVFSERTRIDIEPVGPCMVSGEGACASYYQYSEGEE